MTILVLCREENLCNTLAAYARAFRRKGVRLVCIQTGFPFNGALQDCLSLCLDPPSLILHPEADAPYLPWGLANVDIPTACFQVDTYAYTRRRIAWSILFDHVFVFHPGYDEEFWRAGHPGACVLPHAVEVELYAHKETERVLEVGWVGQVRGPVYRTRERLLPELARSFRMNDWSRRYSQEEMARIYLQSRIVANIGRDDFPQDANLRVFEAMAAGALLLTRLPSELTQIGFEEGVHFVGYHETEEIQPLIRKYLAEEPARRCIAEAARAKVMREHTYDRRVEQLLERIKTFGGKLSAPARHWPEGRVRRIYLDYLAANGALAEAATELPKIARHSLRDAAIGAGLLGRAWSKRLGAKLRPGSQAT